MNLELERQGASCRVKTSINYREVKRASIVKEVMLRDLDIPHLFGVLRQQGEEALD